MRLISGPCSRECPSPRSHFNLMISPSASEKLAANLTPRPTIKGPSDSILSSQVGTWFDWLVACAGSSAAVVSDELGFCSVWVEAVSAELEWCVEVGVSPPDSAVWLDVWSSCVSAWSAASALSVFALASAFFFSFGCCVSTGLSSEGGFEPIWG